MKFGTEIGSGAASIDRRGLRWVVILLALLLVGAGLFFTAPAGHAEGPYLPPCSDGEDLEFVYEGDGACEQECPETGACTFEDPFGDTDWTATCTNCGDLTIRDPDDFADIEIFADEFLLVLTATGKGAPPGHVVVEKVGSGNLPKCTGNTPTNCYKANRVAGHTQITVRIDGDPRLRFSP